MRKAMIILVVMVAVVSSVSSAFAWGMNDGQAQYRGNGNAPYTNLNRFNVDPNVAMQMSQRDFNEYMRRLREVQRYHNDTIRNDRAAAAAAKAWTSRQDRNSFSYQLERALGNAVSDIIGGTGQGFERRIQRQINGRRK